MRFAVTATGNEQKQRTGKIRERLGENCEDSIGFSECVFSFRILRPIFTVRSSMSLPILLALAASPRFASASPAINLADAPSMGSDWMVGWADWIAPTGALLLALLLVVLCSVAWVSNLISLPGNWFAVAILAAYAWWGPDEGRVAIGNWPLAIAFAVAVIAEIVEFIASAWGAKRAGASKKATFYALVGSMIGALAGAVVGVPVPIVGSVLAAILFGGLGATAGAMYGEWTDGKPWRESWPIGQAAFWGRTFGTLGKLSIGSVIVLVAFIAVLV